MKNITGAQGAVIVRLLMEAMQSTKAAGKRLLEAGYTGQKKDKNGHTRYYQDGRQVKNPNAKEKAQINAAAGTPLPAGQTPAHNDAATRVDALSKDTPPEHVAALANDLMNMSVADLTKLSKGPAPKDANGLSDKHKADYKAALDAQEDADTAEGKIAAGKEVENIVRGIADDMGVDFFDAYDMLEKENDEAGLTPGYAPPTDDPKKKDNVTPAPTTDKTPAAAAPPKATLKKDPRDKIYEKLIKKGKPIHNATDDANGIHEIDRKHITPELRRLLQSDQSLERGWNGPPEETESFQLKDKADVTGDPLDDGMILIDKRKKGIALKQRHLDALHAAGKNTDNEAADKKAKADANVENAIMHHLKNNPDATASELRKAAGHKEYDEKNPLDNPANAAIDRLEKSGKIKKGGGGNPLFSKADKAPTAAADKPGFTGTDSQGRQWQDGELVAAKNTPPSPRAQLLSGVSSTAKANGKRTLEKTGKLPHELTLNEFSAVVDPQNAKWQNGQDPSQEHLEFVKSAMIHEPEKVPTSVLQMYADKDASISNELQNRNNKKPSPAAGMNTDALALDALRLKSNKKPHNPAHITPDAMASLKQQGFIDAANKLTNDGRAHLYLQKGKAVRKATGPAKPQAATAPAPAAPTTNLGADADALEALRLKSNKKQHNVGHITPDAVASLKRQGFIDEGNKLTPEGRLHLAAQKFSNAPKPTGTAAGAPGAPKPKWKRAARNKDSLISIVKRKGGINSDSVKAGYDYQADIIEGGLLHAIRKQGMGLDEMAQSLMVEGHIIVPEGVDPGEHLLSEMKARHHSALRNTDKEIESEEAAYYKAKQAALEGGHDERSIEGSGRSGAQTGESEGQKEGATELDEWDNSGAGAQGSGEESGTVTGDGYDSADADDYDRNATGQVDTSFNFGANVDEPKADEDSDQDESQEQDDFNRIVLGKTFKDKQGNEYLAHSKRHGKVTAFPIVDGKPVVNNQSAKYFAVTKLAKLQNAGNDNFDHSLTADDFNADEPAAPPAAAAAAPPPDDAVARHMQRQAFTGTDAQGREWRNGELVAAKDEPTKAPAGNTDLFGNPTKPAPKGPETMPGLFGEQVPIAPDAPAAAAGEPLPGSDNPLDRAGAGRGKQDATQDMFGLFGPGTKAKVDAINNGPDADPVTEPTTPAAAAAQPQPNDTPRTQAARVSAAMEGDFENARASAVPNMGKDLKGSARHKAMAWKGLQDAEANGTAEALVKRDELLKHDPSNLSSILDADNFLEVLTGHLAMQAFPKEVHNYAQYVSNTNEHKSTPAELREQYYEAFTEIKKIVEEGPTVEVDHKEITKNINKKLKELISKFRKEGQGEPSPRLGKNYDGDRYNPVANSLINMQQRVLNDGPASVLGKVNDFGRRLQKTTKDGRPSAETLQLAIKATGDILEGKSFNQAFDTVEKKAAGFDYSSAYGTKITRTGGKKIDMSEQSTSSPGAKVFMDDMKVRGVQFGNSLPDQERVYHAEKSAEALSDLTSILGLPDDAAGLGGKLGLAIGARGKAGAAAHFEPWQADNDASGTAGGPVINLTRANGAGSLAHEWGHGLDHFAANNGPGGKKFVSKGNGSNLSPLTSKAMKKVQEAMDASGFSSRLEEEIKLIPAEKQRHNLNTKTERDYWRSPEEKFARTFERHVQNKLHEAGRENTYLTGLHKVGHPLWPTNEEMAHIAPHMDALIAAIAAEKFPNHKMPAPAPAAPKAAAPAPAPAATPAESKADNPAHAAWIKRGSNPNENRNAAFQAIHGRPPTFQELHGGPGGLYEKLKNKPMQTAPTQPKDQWVDVTPAGYGPSDDTLPPSPPPAATPKKSEPSLSSLLTKALEKRLGKFKNKLEATMPTNEKAQKIKLVQAIIARRGIKPPQPKPTPATKKTPEASGDADPRVKRIRELMDAYC